MKPTDINLNVTINREGVTNDEIKWIREKMSDLTSSDMKCLLDGNRFAITRGMGKNALSVNFSVSRTQFPNNKIG